MLGPSEYAKESPKHALKAILSFLRWELRNGRLLADDESKLWDQVDHKLAICAHCIEQHAAPSGYFLVTLAEELAHQGPKGLSQRGIGDVALVLIELAAREKAAWRDQNLMQFIDDRGFANTGVAGDEHDL